MTLQRVTEGTASMFVNVQLAGAARSAIREPGVKVRVSINVGGEHPFRTMLVSKKAALDLIADRGFDAPCIWTRDAAGTVFLGRTQF